MDEFLEELRALGVSEDIIDDIAARRENTQEEVIGTDEADDVIGGEGNDLLLGGAGDDSMFGDLGDDNMNGEAGNDMLRGMDGDDVLIDREGDNELLGGNGNEILIGGDGNDIIDGEAGTDYIQTGEGNDTIRLFGSDGENYISDFDLENDRLELLGLDLENLQISRDEATDSVMITDGGDFKVVFLNQKEDLTMDDFNITNQSAEDQTLFNPYGNVDKVVRGTDGDDYRLGTDKNELFLGGKGDDVIHAGHGEDQLRGGEGADNLFGSHGADILKGGSGNDNLDGGGHNDIIEGGAGDDLVRGGAGRDTFVFSNGDGNDVVNDFNEHQDRLLLDNPDDYEASENQYGELTLTNSNGDSMTFQGLSLEDYDDMTIDAM